MFSYCGRVVVRINGCPSVLPDVEHYGDYMDASFAELTSGAKTSAQRRDRGQSRRARTVSSRTGEDRQIR